MTGHATSDTLSKDLYVLSGQFLAFEGQMGDLRKLISEGFEKIEHKIDGLDKRVRLTEAAHSIRTGQHNAFGWIGNGVQMVIAALAGALGGHFLK